MTVNRARVVGAIRSIRDAVLADRAVGTVREVNPRGCEIVREACKANGLTMDEWTAALDGDAELASLFDKMEDELNTDPPDPGPYAEISRESSTGQPGTDDHQLKNLPDDDNGHGQS